MANSRRFPRALRARIKAAFRPIKETFKHLHFSLRIAAFAIALFLFNQGWTMSGAGEYLVALIFTVLAVLFTFVAVYGWSGIPRQPKITRLLKAVLVIVSLLWGVYSTVVIVRQKGDKPWGNITSADFYTLGSYLTPDTTPIRPLLSTSILIAFLVGAAVTYFVMRWRTKNQLCPDTRLHALAENDKATIKDLVRIIGILYKPDFGKAYIDFVFSVFNNSLYDIVIDNTIKKGSIRFGEDNEKFYYEPKIEGDKPISCGSRRGTYFFVRQAIRAEDIPRLRDTDDVLLYFYELEIMFQGAAESAGIGPTRLETNYYLQTKKGMWRDWDRLEAVFGYTDKQWADITSGKVEKPADSKDSQANPTATQPEPEAKTTPQPKPNLVLKRVRVARTWQNVISDDDPRGAPIALVEFKNETDADFPVESAQVRAVIDFEQEGGSDRRHIADGAWHDVRGTSHLFRLGESKELIIAIRGREGVRTVGVVEQRIRRIHNTIEFVPHVLPGDQYIVGIELVDVVQSTSLGKHRFNLTTRPELLIERA